MSKKTNKNKKIIPIIVIFIIICAGTFFALNILQTSNDETGKTTDNSTINSTDISTEPVENSKKEDAKEKEKIEKKPEIIQNDGEDPNKSEELTGTLTTANISRDKLVIRVNIDQFLTSGKCILNLKSTTSTIREEANIITSASTSTCEGFDIPTSELSSGKWNIEILLNSNNKTGKITGEIDV